MNTLPPADAAERDKAICERERNVIVDAGAGTGKTTLLVARLLHLIAPEDDGPALSLHRIAAITFTRKAAGELKLRLREALLFQRGRRDLSEVRQERLAQAIEILDNASISTVHSFADRLLRLLPADARLSPAYEIADDTSELVEETYRWLLEPAQQGGLDGDFAELAIEATETVRMFQAAGLLVRTQESEWADRLGLDAFVRDVIESRDQLVTLPALSVPDRGAVGRCVDELASMVKALCGNSAGSQRLRRLCKQALRVADAEDDAEALRRAVAWARDVKKTAKHLVQREHFDGDPQGWDAWSWISGGTRGVGKKKQEREGGPLAAALVEPLMAFMARRLVRLRPVILARYSEVKRARGVVDQIDLLIELRDLLQRNREARAFYQARFDHLLVDEFQDTDPLQAEIVMYLCEAGSSAECVDDVVLQPGRLTIVGDPKQSIYRFRRADIAMYGSVCDKVRKTPVSEAQLTVNFRSAASILGWLNEAFDVVLGPAGNGPLYDSDSGTVRNLRLVPSGKSHADAAVHVLPFGNSELNVEESRDLEGEALAHYLRFLVEESEVHIADPRSHELRRPQYGDIAVMMIATQTVHHLTSELDRIGVPHVVRGGTLFMRDALHQQFVLGLRALSDHGDGVARAALMRPPFFAVGLQDLVRGRDPEAKSEVLRAAEALITVLRRDRHRATPAETARGVLEQTGFGRYVAASVNGTQRLARLYQLCTSLDVLARVSNLDFDGVTAVARGWIDAPPRIEVPLPVDADAVQVITTHQAKGLEWPIVALWDGRAGWRAFLPQVAFTVEAATGQWALKLDGLQYDPSEKQLQKREGELRAAERKRVAYVAATRARDVLIIPEAGAPDTKSIAGMLLVSAGGKGCQRVAAYQGQEGGWWKGGVAVSSRPIAAVREELEGEWVAAVGRAFEERLRPAAVTTVAHARVERRAGASDASDLSSGVAGGVSVASAVSSGVAGWASVASDVRVGVAGGPGASVASASGADDVELAPIAWQSREGRYGAVFGVTVHRALQLVIAKGVSAEVAVAQAAREQGLAEHLDVAIEDVKRTHASLRDGGLLGHALRVEYPISGSLDAGTLLSGYVDLLVASPEELMVIDFKTDAPPRGDVGSGYPGYVEQVRAYVRLIEGAGVAGGRAVRAGLLFTGDGALRWV